MMKGATGVLPERLRSVMWKLREQKAFEEMIRAPSFTLAKRNLSCVCVCVWCVMDVRWT